MSKQNTTRFTINLTADLAVAVTRAAAESAITSEEFISECVGQHCETALRHRVLIQRQNDVDEALLEHARLVERLSAGPNEPSANICRYHPADAE
jgi:uncharacterized protein (DUF1778 family)